MVVMNSVLMFLNFEEKKRGKIRIQNFKTVRSGLKDYTPTMDVPVSPLSYGGDSLESPSKSSTKHSASKNFDPIYSVQTSNFDLFFSPIVPRTVGSDTCCSSSDDTSDEAYYQRHLPYELQEQNASMRVYEDFSIGDDQDLSGLSGFNDSGHTQSPAVVSSSVHLACSENTFSYRQRLAARNLIQAGASIKVQRDLEETKICIDTTAKLIVQLETSTASPTSVKETFIKSA